NKLSVYPKPALRIHPPDFKPDQFSSPPRWHEKQFTVPTTAHVLVPERQSKALRRSRLAGPRFSYRLSLPSSRHMNFPRKTPVPFEPLFLFTYFIRIHCEFPLSVERDPRAQGRPKDRIHHARTIRPPR